MEKHYRITLSNSIHSPPNIIYLKASSIVSLAHSIQELLDTMQSPEFSVEVKHIDLIEDDVPN